MVLIPSVIGELQEGKLLIAVYASGNTLESDESLITEDIRQMVAGLNSTDPETLELLVAYGGADKPGWNGMTVASAEDLEQDLLDGTIGNDTNYRFSMTGANMGSPSTLGYFLNYIGTNYQYERIFLVLIGHGQAYTGMLFDQNHQDDGLTVSELVDALKEGGYNVDLIGFDSCLMGCIETASSVSGYASYMIASEESEPAEGWQYEPWISYLAANPDAPHQDHVIPLFTAYMENKEPGKTISLLDLSGTGRITGALEVFSQDISALLQDPDDKEVVLHAIQATRQFGLTSTGELEEVTLDLYDFTIQVQDRAPYTLLSASTLIEAIDQTVLLSRHDDITDGAYGISILSPVMIPSSFYEYFRTEAAVTPAWDIFICSYLELTGS